MRASLYRADHRFQRPRDGLAAAFASLSRAVARLRREERGLTLIELLVTLIVGMAIFAATTSILISGLHKQISTQYKANQLAQAQSSVQRLVRDLRQATSVTYTSASSISYKLPQSTSTTYTFSCSGTTCTRNNGSTTVTAITSLASTSVFSASYNSTSHLDYLGVSVQISATKHSNVTLSDGADLRDVTLGT